jgi:hypothetical protein
LKAVKNETVSVCDVPDIPKGVALFDGFEALPACAYKSNMKMSTEHCWNDINRGNTKYSEKNLSQ